LVDEGEARRARREREHRVEPTVVAQLPAQLDIRDEPNAASPRRRNEKKALRLCVASIGSA